VFLIDEIDQQKPEKIGLWLGLCAAFLQHVSEFSPDFHLKIQLSWEEFQTKY